MISLTSKEILKKDNANSNLPRIAKPLIKLFFWLGLLLVSSCVNDNEPAGGNVSLYDKLPQFSIVMNTGETFNTQNLMGKISLIMFFNTNCPDCQKELPVIQELWEIYAEDDNVVIIPISREEGEEEILEYWTENNLSLPFSPQENRDIYSLFAKSIIPRIYISDRNGTVVFMSGDENMPSLGKLTATIESQR
ncbi:MAG: TlpA family protein disulfide reductase [Muribaculaceae bacterium]|nr:TlpA family protein disulfide reductase [Muribaculaceae bacterium]